MVTDAHISVKQTETELPTGELLTSEQTSEQTSEETPELEAGQETDNSEETSNEASEEAAELSTAPPTATPPTEAPKPAVSPTTAATSAVEGSEAPANPNDLLKENAGKTAEQTPEPVSETEVSVSTQTPEPLVMQTATAPPGNGTGGGFPLENSVLYGLLAAVILLLAGALILLARLRRKRTEDEVWEDMSDYELHTAAPQQNGVNAVKLAEVYPGAPVRIGTVHDVGKRSMQQDSFGLSDLQDKQLVEEKGILAVVADGMGGLSDGERMSQMVVVNMLQGFDEAEPGSPAPSLLMELVDRAKNEVNADLGEEKLGRCGSTVVSVIIKKHSLSYISVGDSHIYVWRDGKLIKLNQDHNYAAELDELVRRGEKTPEEALSDPQRAALTSYIGMGELELIDQNIQPIELQSGDRVLLMSDGIYGTIPEDKLCSLMNTPLRQTCMLLDNEIHTANKQNQDNYTCIVIEIR